LRAHLVNPKIVHVDELGAHDPEFQKLVDESVPPSVNEISLTGLGDCKMTLGLGGEITSIAKATGAAIGILPVESTVRN
jgi:hypothetical protein